MRSFPDKLLISTDKNRKKINTKMPDSWMTFGYAKTPMLRVFEASISMWYSLVIMSLFLSPSKLIFQAWFMSMLTPSNLTILVIIK